MALSHSERVLGAILNAERPRRDLLGAAMLKLDPEHFGQDIHKNIYKFLQKYYDRTGEVMPLDVFKTALSDYEVEPAKALAYTKSYETLAGISVTDSDFRWSVDELRALEAKRQTGVALTEAMEILERGYEDSKGNYYKGHEQARSFLSAKIHEIDRQSSQEEMPEGNVFADWESILKDYEDRKSGKVDLGVQSGIHAIDKHIGGFQRGELVLVCAFPGIGKSQLSTQTAWHASVVEKKNVYFATSETLRPQVMRRLLARHSRLPQFDHPINSADIKKGTLSPEDEKVFQDVLEDWHYNSEYGVLNVVQMPAQSVLSYAENRMKDMARTCEVDLCIIDYLALFKAQQKRGNEREEFNEIIRNAKAIAQGSFDGRGVPVISPWQIRREAHDAALRSGHYTMGALAETSEADKSADTIITLLREETNNRDLQLQFLKMRDDDLPPIATVSIDFRNTYLGAHNAAPSLSPGNTQSDFMRGFMDDL